MIPPVTRGKLAFIINSAWLGTIVFMLLIFALALFIQQIFALSFWSLLTSLLGLLFPVVQWLISKFRKDQTGKILRGIKKKY